MNPVDGTAVAQDLCGIDGEPGKSLRRPQDCKIYLSSLSLTNFRNYEYARLEVSPEPVVLIGENGAGKTNILEAISLLSPGRGLRRAKLSEIDRNSPLPSPLPLAGEGIFCSLSPQGGGLGRGNPWAISANGHGRLGEVKIGTGRATDNPEDSDKRIIKIDGKITRGQAELSRHLSIIWLTPQMEQLFTEGAQAGRKFLDRLVYSFDADHASRINEYDYAMRERNKLLQYNRGRADLSWLDALEQTMTACAVAIAGARLSTCEHINYTIAASPLSFPKALVDVAGFAENLLKNGNTGLEVENALKTAYADGRNQDAAAGRTLTGTHRSELRVTHILKNMPVEACSTGEQKALMMSVVLAQARSGARWHGVVPLILLDEVAGHLDATRRLELFEEICDIGAQTWMTGTDASLFVGLEGKAQFFKVDNGKIFKEQK
jgi:DNA replication and repair protein RecF